MSSTDSHNKLLPQPQVEARYGISNRTPPRWVAQGLLPPPIKINKRNYWRLSDLEALERAAMGRRDKEPETAPATTSPTPP